MIENPITWPNGARCAVAITFDMDSDSEFHAMNPSTSYQKISTLSWLRYDRIAVPRILKLYEKHEIKQTFFVPGWTAEKYPDIVRQIVDNGHEVGHHGYLHERPNTLSRSEEEYWFMRAIDALERVTGNRPRGFRAPFYGFSENTAEFLARENFLYDSSLMGDDVPYMLRTPHGPLVELPTDWSMDDWPQYVHNPDLHFAMPIKSPEEAMQVFKSQFDAAWEFGALWVSVWHPFVSGRLARLAEIDKMISYMKEKGEVWFASLTEIAEYTVKVKQEGTFKPRSETVPVYDGTIDELSVLR